MAKSTKTAKTRRPARIDFGVAAMLAEAWDTGRVNGYSDQASRDKDMVHTQTVKLLRWFATEVMGLKPGQFEVRSNKGGVAVSGEVMLYVDKVGDRGVGLFLQISAAMGGPCHAVLFRTSEGRVNGRFDCGAGMKHHNNYVTAADALATEAGMRKFYRERIVPLMYVPQDDGAGYFYPQIGETSPQP